MDVLSDVLREFRVDGSVFCRFRGSGRWAVEYPSGEDAVFHVVTEGTCVLDVATGAGGAGERHVLTAGDFVVLPHGAAHVLRDAAPGPAVPPVSIQTAAAGARRAPPGAAVPLGAEAAGGSGPAAADASTYLCGAFRFADGRTHPVLDLLPAVLRVRATAADAAGPLGPWLATYLAATTCEAASGRPGADFVLARLSDVLFVHAVRAHLTDAAAGGAGWLGALRDPAVGRALALLHREPARAWTVASLAREVAMSRSRFAARFTALVGRPPLDYLAAWRMQRARGLLRAGSASVAEVAGRLGYRSEAAFSHAFRRHLGVAPGAYRRRAPAVAPASAVGTDGSAAAVA